MYEKFFPELLEKYDDRIINSWKGVYISEKYDGWRMLWIPLSILEKEGYNNIKNGGIFITRKGNYIDLDKEFYEEATKLAPDHILDGELWSKYGDNILLPDEIKEQYSLKEQHKNFYTFRIFDIPSYNDTFENRTTYLKAKIQLYELKISSRLNRLKYVDQIYYPMSIIKESNDLIKMHMDEIVKKGGEGIVLRNPNSTYKFNCRTKDTLKYKPKDTTELIVIGFYRTDTNIDVNYISSLICKTMDNIECRITFKRYKPDNLFIGSIISVVHSQTTVNGLPKFPVFNGIVDPRSISAEAYESFQKLSPCKELPYSNIPIPIHTYNPIPIHTYNPIPVPNRQITTSYVSSELLNKPVVFTDEPLRLENGKYVFLERGQSLLVKGSRDSYIVKVDRSGSSLYCSCHAWKYQRLPPKERVCKHMINIFDTHAMMYHYYQYKNSFKNGEITIPFSKISTHKIIDEDDEEYNKEKEERKEERKEKEINSSLLSLISNYYQNNNDIINIDNKDNKEEEKNNNEDYSSSCLLSLISNYYQNNDIIAI